jgi:hypothetical protein
MGVTYTTTVSGEPGKNVTGLPVPAEAVAALGTQKKPKVTVSLNGYRYRSTVAVFGDVLILPLSQEHRAAAGVQAGDKVEVTLELDLEPRTVDVPDDLRVALAGKAGALDAFDVLSYTMRKEYVRQVNEAKAQATRERRIAGIVEKLGGA